MQWQPGVLVRARGRDWVVESVENEGLWLRPFASSGKVLQYVVPDLENDLRPSEFPPPTAQDYGPSESFRLLRDAVTLTLTNAAGPLRSFAHIDVEPRPYQLVPLLMALQLDPVRLLIADDVGVGKTIEAGLILRELWDRGIIDRFAVIAPPHLCDQWELELRSKFHLEAVSLTAKTADRVERQVPRGQNLFDHFPVVVMSVDYIKSERNREYFLQHAPPMVVVDEAHTATLEGQRPQQRYRLLRDVAAEADRHLILLTATPHSGKEEGFYSLLSLLHPDFERLKEVQGADDPLRQRLARHFVQRRRGDIQDQWRDSGLFPQKKSADAAYRLKGLSLEFFERVRQYFLGLGLEREAQKGQEARMIWYATLALLRCAASSPASAISALRTRLGEELTLEDAEDPVLDGSEEGLSQSDIEPGANTGRPVEDLVRMAQQLCQQGPDPKLETLVKVVEDLLRDTFRPVVFCRYIATAHYVGQALQKRFPKARIEVVTGELSPEERQARAESLFDAECPILVATDCLSEGVNLQEGFNAVVHYDLAWNPNRHDQREGRVDRFGQRAREVRCVTLYGENNPVDGLVLGVILRKAQTIKEQLGVSVPVPTDREKLEQALIKAALIRSARPLQEELFELEEVRDLEARWRDVEERLQKTRTIFAQRGLRPDEVRPEWERQQRVLGGESTIREFVTTVLIRYQAPPRSPRPGTVDFEVALISNPSLRARLKELPERLRILESQGRWLHTRSSPLVQTLASTVLEQALTGQGPAQRGAVLETSAVRLLTTLVLLHLRYELREGNHSTFVEEAVAVGMEGARPRTLMDQARVEELIQILEPTTNLAPATIRAKLEEALRRVAEAKGLLEEVARRRAQELREDHQRVYHAGADAQRRRRPSKVGVEFLPPVNVLGLCVLIPEV